MTSAFKRFWVVLSAIGAFVAVQAIADPVSLTVSDISIPEDGVAHNLSFTFTNNSGAAVRPTAFLGDRPHFRVW